MMRGGSVMERGGIIAWEGVSGRLSWRFDMGLAWVALQASGIRGDVIVVCMHCSGASLILCMKEQMIVYPAFTIDHEWHINCLLIRLSSPDL